MPSLNPRQIGEQNEAYGKGVVLGLTMAEAAILIIFVLLLLLVVVDLRRSELIKKFEGAEPVPAATLERYVHAESTLNRVAAALELPAVSGDSSFDFDKLIRAVREAAATPGARSALAEATSTLAEIRQARAEIEKILETGRKGDADSVAKAVEQQSFQVANQEGQLKVAERKVALAGQGKGERPCWVDPDGTIVYFYDVVLSSDGIRMRERIYTARERERALLPAPTVDPKEFLTEDVFSARTRPLFQYSKAINCRFFVVVYDATASHEKTLYKRLLSTVEDHFYKLLSRDAAPF